MTVKQISVFVENKPGRLAELTEVLSKNGIDLRALSIAETEDFGIVRMIVDDSYKTACILKEAQYVFSITRVLAVELPDEPGGLSKVLDILGKNQVNLEYADAFITRTKDLAYMIFRVEDNDKAISVLTQNHIKLVCQDALNTL